MLFSKSAKLAGASGFFFDGDTSAPKDAIEVKNNDANAALNLGEKLDYDFDEKGKLVTFAAEEVAPSGAELAAIAEAKRAAAYRDEADPLYFKMQRGEVTKENWLAKIEKIKARFPKPEGV